MSHVQSARGFDDAVTAFLAAVEAQDADGATARLLLDAGADPNAKDSRYGVPVLYAVVSLHVELLGLGERGVTMRCRTSDTVIRRKANRYWLRGATSGRNTAYQ